MNTIDVLNEIVDRNSYIMELRFFRFDASDSLQRRLIDPSMAEEAAIQSAIARKRESGFSFWEALLAEAADGTEWTARLIELTLTHHQNEDIITVHRSKLRKFLTDLGGDVAVNSKVKMTNGKTAHIPLLDFKLKSSKSALPLAESCVSALGMHGYLLDSGKSFHFIGQNLISSSELLNLLARFVLLHPLSDRAWCAHQIIERSASLRVTRKRERMPQLLSVI